MTYTLIHNGTLIDGNGGAPIKDGAVLVEDSYPVGPALTGRGYDADVLARLIDSPPASNGVWRMPALGLKPADIRAVAAFLAGHRLGARAYLPHLAW